MNITIYQFRAYWELARFLGTGPSRVIIKVFPKCISSDQNVDQPIELQFFIWKIFKHLERARERVSNINEEKLLKYQGREY